MIPRLKVMEGNLVLECNNCTHLLLEVRTQFTNDHDLEVVLKDLDSWEGQTKDLDGNEPNRITSNRVVLIVWLILVPTLSIIMLYSGQIRGPLY